MSSNVSYAGHAALKRYRRTPSATVTAVRLDLELEGGGFSYQKWGGLQRCKAGDWIVNNDGETYTVDADSFAETYTAVCPGVYTKTARVFALRADSAGSLPTKEGASAYQAGDMLVFNDEACTDGYVIAAVKFDSMYELDR